MGLGDLYERKRYLEGKIWDCHNTIIRLEGFDGNLGQIGKLKREIEELKKDDKTLESIYNNLNSAKGFFNSSASFLSKAESYLPKYFNGASTKGCLRDMSSMESTMKTKEKDTIKIRDKASSARTLVKQKKKKKEEELKRLERILRETKQNKKDYESDLEDVEYEIENYDEDDD